MMNMSKKQIRIVEITDSEGRTVSSFLVFLRTYQDDTEEYLLSLMNSDSQNKFEGTQSPLPDLVLDMLAGDGVNIEQLSLTAEEAYKFFSKGLEYIIKSYPSVEKKYKKTQELESNNNIQSNVPSSEVSKIAKEPTVTLIPEKKQWRTSKGTFGKKVEEQ